MIISVNNKEKEVGLNTSVQVLATDLQLPQNGIALAVNNKIIPRTEWENHILQENDNLVIIKAVCGG